MRIPKTRYTKSGGVYVAYQVFGDGPIDVVWTPGNWNNVELVWDVPTIASAYRRLASFSRVITFDPRGSGLSVEVAATIRSRSGWTTSARSSTRLDASVRRSARTRSAGR